MVFMKKYLLALLALFVAHKTVVAEEEGPLQFLENKYNGLTNKGKFVATAAVGFVGTRIAVNTAVGVLKFGAAAFIT